MDKREMLYTGIMLLGVLVSSLSQVLLKRSANSEHSSRIREYLNPAVLTAYAIFFFATFCTVFAYRVIPLSMGPILESSSYLFVTLFGFFFFRERITKKKLTALILILGGIGIYTLF